MNELHQRYAQEISALGGIKSPALRRALAMVRREDFLPPGPWLIESLEGSYYPSDDDAVDHILHAVGVAIDADRLLNNANPAKICVQIERADIRPGETVVHVGAGFGYFSALMAELVGPSGTVVAAEIDPHLRKQAGVNLAAWPQVRMTGDALACALPPCDLLFASAGLADLPLDWILALKSGGRMIVPMTDGGNHGVVFHFYKLSPSGPLSATAASFTRHYPCAGTRDPAALSAMSKAFSRPFAQVRSLRLDKHPASPECWMHGAGWCLSYRAPELSAQSEI
jgi:protein-L-isoaspartate(D-aspartate) O-methyltransferase